MSNWLDRWDRRYTDRVRLVEILPVLAQEPRFALKGSTAINLFEHDLPRLSVDIDLAWLPVHDYVEDAKLIAEALGRLADAMRARPLQLQMQASAGEGGVVTRLVASRGRARRAAQGGGSGGRFVGVLPFQQPARRGCTGADRFGRAVIRLGGLRPSGCWAGLNGGAARRPDCRAEPARPEGGVPESRNHGNP